MPSKRPEVPDAARSSLQRRVVVYVDPLLHDALKKKLRARGVNVSWWFSKKASEEVRK